MNISQKYIGKNFRDSKNRKDHARRSRFSEKWMFDVFKSFN